MSEAKFSSVFLEPLLFNEIKADIYNVQIFPDDGTTAVLGGAHLLFERASD